MILVLDIGNSQIYGGVFDDDRLALQFRRAAPNAIQPECREEHGTDHRDKYPTTRTFTFGMNLVF